MSRSNLDKPFYVDVGTSIVAVRCASNHDVVLRYDHSWRPSSIELAKTACDRMNKEAEIGRPRRNCDVGTPEEQFARFAEFCHANVDISGNCRATCPFTRLGNCRDRAECYSRWAQLPYESEEAK